jgi:hypothetical protein
VSRARARYGVAIAGSPPAIDADETAELRRA